MGLDDGAAHCQSHAHSFGFGGEEGVEQPAHFVGIESSTGIADGYQHIAPTSSQRPRCQSQHHPQLIRRCDSNARRGEPRDI